MADGIVIIGAGQAAQSAAEAARGAGFDGPITMVGEEPVRPYQRPPLSKKYLLGDAALDRLFFRSEDFYRGNAIDLRLGARVEAVDRGAQRVRLREGDALGYDQLLIATGARPRVLPAAIGGALPGVMTMRGLADADAVRPRLVDGARAVVVGGGYIGLEAAAVFAQKGLAVTVVEQAPRILARVACAETAARVAELHRAHGVDIRCGARLERLAPGADGAVAAAVLAGGERLAADLVMVGIGVIPNAELAAEAGLDVGDGILVGADGRSSDPKIFAAGDVARADYLGRSVRLESVQNAIDQAAAAGRAMAGAPAPTNRPVPWFWSDQFDLSLQIVGLGDRADRHVVRPGKRPGAASVWYYETEGRDAPRLAAVDALSDARAYMVAKRLLEAGASPDPSRVADPAADLKALIA